MADDRNRNRGRREDPRDPERTAAHRLGPPMRPMRPGRPRDFSRADTGYVDRVTDDGAPVDVAAVRRDDELIEALAAGGAVSTSDQAEFQLASLLADWRDEIVTTPVQAGPSVDEMLRAAETSRRSAFGAPAANDGDETVAAVSDLTAARARRKRFSVVAGSAAAAVAILGGGAVLVNSASPGDGALWGVKEVVFADAASQTLASSQANSEIENADRDIDSRDTVAARAALSKARDSAEKVRDAKKRAELQERIRAAEARAGLPVGSTDLDRGTTPKPGTVPPPATDTRVTTVPTTTPQPQTTDQTQPTAPTEPTTTPRPTEPTTTTTTTKPSPSSRPTEPTTTRPTTTRPASSAVTTTTTTPPRQAR